MRNDPRNKILKEFFYGFIKIHILYHTDKRPFYGQELREELAEHGYALSYGTLYPLLHKLCGDGFLFREDRNVGGKIRKYYSITDRGKSLLDEARLKMKELTDEVME